MLNTQFLYQQNAHFILYYLRVVIFSSIHHYIIFYGYKGQLVNQSVIFYKFQKIIIKKTEKRFHNP